MTYQLSFFETLDEFARNQPDSTFEACGLSAAMTIAGGAVVGGRIKIVKIVPGNDLRPIIVMSGGIHIK